MDLQNFKINLPKNWKEVSRMGSGKQVVIRVYHINPLTGINPEDRQDHALPSSNDHETVTRVSPQTAGPNPLTDFYSGMKGAIESGLMPPELTMDKLNSLWQGMTATPHAEMPPEADLAGDIGIVEFDDAATAYQMLKQNTSGFAQGETPSVLGGISKLGVTKDSTMADYEQNETLKAMMSKEQFAGLLKMLQVEAQQMPKVQAEMQKTGLKYLEKDFLGGKAVFVEMPNPNRPPKPAAPAVKNDKAGMGGSRGNDITAAMPKIPKQNTYTPTITQCMGIAYGKFLINGSLLSGLGVLPSGNTPCQSLTGTKKVTSQMREGGDVFTDVALVPTASTLATEGYLNKEEVEEIFKKVLADLR